ncbi:MAG: hypothetical protein IKA25_00185 [Alphaproteobacteria bacterium]|nr:hypothetical protein [Alphaproteobacteria bacterium]
MKKVLLLCFTVCMFGANAADLPACRGTLQLWPNVGYYESSCPAGTIELVVASLSCEDASSAQTCGMFVNDNGRTDVYTGEDASGVFEVSGFCGLLQ